MGRVKNLYHNKKTKKINLKVSKKVFNPTYLPHLTNNHRTQIYFGGSSSGKSYFLAQRLVIDIIKGGRNFLVCRQVAGTIRESVFNEIVKAIKFFKLEDFFHILESTMRITCINGYQIIFRGLDDIEKVKSITPKQGVITDIWVEEATETEYASIKQLYKRLRGISEYPKRVVISFNPIIQSHWLYKEYFTNWDDSKTYYEDELLSILKTTYKDNTFLDKDTIYDLENEKDELLYQVYSLGNWGILGELIYKNWKSADLSKVIPQFDKVIAGLDWGFSKDPASYLKTYYDKKHKKLYCWNEIYSPGMLNSTFAGKIKETYNRERIIADSAQPKDIAEFRDVYKFKIEGAKKGANSIEAGIRWLQGVEIIVDVNCVNLKRELTLYHYKKDKHGIVQPIPVDKDNHLLDVLRYCSEGHRVNSGFVFI